MAPAAGPHEEVITCDLADKAAVHALVEGVDAIIHFGGVSTEHSFEDILGPNICGVFHVYEAARKHGVKRVIFASSNHTIGFYRQDQRIDAHAPRRPDSYYGLSKCYGEDVASFYFDRYGIETVSIRIGSSFPQPQNPRMLCTWLSYDDLVQLIERGLFTPTLATPSSTVPPTTAPCGGTTAMPSTWAMCPRTARNPSALPWKPNRRPPPMTRAWSIKAALSPWPAPSTDLPRQEARP